MRRVGWMGTLVLAGCVGTFGVEPTGARTGPKIDPDDMTPPRIEILSPALDSIVEGTTVTITGHAEDDETDVTVTLGGSPVRVERDGSFTWTGTVEPGAHRFRFEAKDGGGHVATAWTALLA